MKAWAIGLAAAALCAGMAHAADVEVEVQNVGDAQGVVRAEACAKAEWLTSGCKLKGVAAARPGTTVVTIRGVPPGDWAIVAYHDKNDDGHVDQSWLGVPEEGVGFSRNPPLGLSGPAFANAALEVPPVGAVVPVRLRFE